MGAHLKSLRTLAVTAALLAGAAGAQAALVNRGGGMIYDTTLNLTWLADMNHAQTSGYTGTGVNADGTMAWAAANTWANNLSYGGFDDWRLATVNSGDTSCSDIFNPGGGVAQQYSGYNCTGGELSHLFVADLGNKAGESVLTQTGDTATQMANLALFSHVQSYAYWSGLAYAPVTTLAWYFDTRNGVQSTRGNVVEMYAVAVRPGDVAAVPEPQTYAVMLLGLGALMAARRKRPL
jgi:hypothetical protein